MCMCAHPDTIDIYMQMIFMCLIQIQTRARLNVEIVNLIVVYDQLNRAFLWIEYLVRNRCATQQQNTTHWRIDSDVIIQYVFPLRNRFVLSYAIWLSIKND